MKATTHKTVLLELQFLPSVGYFAALTFYPVVYIEQHENYLKGSYRNRCQILGANGVQRLSIPLKKGKNQQLPIREVRIAYDEPWQARHWQSIRSAYGNSPFFEHYTPHFEPFFKSEFEFLFDYNLELLNTCLRLLKLTVEIRFTEIWSAQPPGGTLDLRGHFHPKKKPDARIFSPVYYPQVFEDRHGFLPNLSVLDLLFCAGPGAAGILKSTVDIQAVDL